MKQHKAHKGFTLIELLVVLAIAAILISIAVPAMDGTMKKGAVRAHVADFKASMLFARAEAVSRNLTVSMCPSDDGASCGTDWSKGWIVFADTGSGTSEYGNGAKAADEEILRVYEYSGSNTARVVDPDNSLNAQTAMTWNVRGYTEGDQRSMVIVCARGNEAKYARGLLMELSGRIMGSFDTDADGVHEYRFGNALMTEPNGLDLSCT